MRSTSKLLLPGIPSSPYWTRWYGGKRVFGIERKGSSLMFCMHRGLLFMIVLRAMCSTAIVGCIVVPICLVFVITFDSSFGV